MKICMIFLLGISIFLNGCSVETTLESPYDINNEQTDYEGFVTQQLEAIKKNPDDPTLYSSLISIYNSKGDYEKSLSLINDNIKNPNLIDRLYSWLYKTYIDMGEYEKAEKIVLDIIDNKNYQAEQEIKDLAKIYRLLSRQDDLVDIINRYKLTLIFTDDDYIELLSYYESTEDIEAIESLSKDIIIEDRSSDLINNFFKTYKRLQSFDSIERLIDRLDLRARGKDDRRHIWYEYWAKNIIEEDTIFLLDSLYYNEDKKIFNSSNNTNNMAVTVDTSGKKTIYLQDGRTGKILDKKKLSNKYEDIELEKKNNFLIMDETILVKAYLNEDYKEYFLINDYIKGRMNFINLNFEDDVKLEKVDEREFIINSKSLNFKKILNLNLDEAEIRKSNRILNKDNKYIEIWILQFPSEEVKMEKEFTIDKYGYYRLSNIVIEN